MATKKEREKRQDKRMAKAVAERKDNNFNKMLLKGFITKDPVLFNNTVSAVLAAKILTENFKEEEFEKFQEEIYLPVINTITFWMNTVEDVVDDKIYFLSLWDCLSPHLKKAGESAYEIVSEVVDFKNGKINFEKLN